MNRVRPARLADAPAIAHIHVETWRAAYAGILSDEYLVRMSEAGQQRQWRHMLRRTDHLNRIFVAEELDEDAATVVGFASCGPARRSPGPHGTYRTGEVYTLYVDQDAQGRGHGRDLLWRCFDTLRAQGRRTALVWVLADNPARFFYEAVGGRRMGMQTERFAGQEVPEIAYGWELRADGPEGR